eukprot:9327889-Pyramimonas_sp.AAC.1
MLAGAAAWSQLSDEAPRVPPYTDPLLKAPGGSEAFASRMAPRGLARLTRPPAARIGAFTVLKKSEKQRPALDCRPCNLRFAPPLRTELGGLSSLSDLEIPVGQALCWAEGDIKGCFYECGISDGAFGFLRSRGRRGRGELIGSWCVGGGPSRVPGPTRKYRCVWPFCRWFYLVAL